MSSNRLRCGISSADKTGGLNVGLDGSSGALLFGFTAACGFSESPDCRFFCGIELVDFACSGGAGLLGVRDITLV